VTLARQPGRLLSRETLAQEVWGYEHLTSSRTIDVHIRRVRQAIEEASSYTYIQTVHGVGYRFEPREKTAS
jgi:DNA-binding response OmpR family regulator